MGDSASPRDDLAALVAAVGPPTLPPNLGNIPDDAPPVRAETPEDQAPAAPAAEPDPAPEPIEEPPADSTRIAALEQELRFLRAGQQAAAPAAPPVPSYGPDTILPFQFSGSDLDRLGIQNTPENVEAINNAFRLAALAGKEAAKHELRAEYGQMQAQQAQGQTLRQSFYGSYPGLEPYQEIVGPIAAQIQQQNPGAPASLLLPAIADATRQKLHGWGVAIDPLAAPSPSATAKPAAARATTSGPRRIRPARQDSGSPTTAATAARLTPVQRDILGMVRTG